MGLKVYINGKFVDSDKASISVFDHGLLYGDGVFEGIRSYNGLVFKLREHVDRLYESAATIRLKIGMSKPRIMRAVIRTLKKNRLKNAYIRLVVTRGVGDLGLDPNKCKKGGTIFIITDKITLYPKRFYENGLAIITAKTRRNMPLALDPRMKSLNYLNNIMAKIEALDAGVQEALMLAHDDTLAECTGDNVFIVKNQKVTTPPTEVGLLEGITRDSVIKIAKRLKIRFSERKIRLGEVYKADECFLTGTAAEIVPVVKVDRRRIGNGKPGPITLKLSEEFHKLTKIAGTRY